MARQPIPSGLVASSGTARTGGAGVGVTVQWQNLDVLAELVNRAAAKGKEKYAVARALDEVGNKTRTRIIRDIARQANKPQYRVRQALATRSAMGSGDGSFIISARDKAISMKEFAPRQIAAGTKATIWKGERDLYRGAFMGPKPGAIFRKLGGHVFARVGKARLPIKKLWGSIIPVEMVRDEAEGTFYEYTAAELPDALAKWIFRAAR